MATKATPKALGLDTEKVKKDTLETLKQIRDEAPYAADPRASVEALAAAMIDYCKAA